MLVKLSRAINLCRTPIMGTRTETATQVIEDRFAAIAEVLEEMRSVYKVDPSVQVTHISAAQTSKVGYYDPSCQPGGGRVESQEEYFGRR